MAKRKKRASLVGEVEEAFSDVANALSVAASGSQIGILELAAEEELAPAPKRRRKPARKVKTPARKRKKTRAVRSVPGRKKKRKSRKTPNRRR